VHAGVSACACICVHFVCVCMHEGGLQSEEMLHMKLLELEEAEPLRTQGGHCEWGL
jgi:hypothetical protein